MAQHIIAADDDALFLFVIEQALAIYCPTVTVTTVMSAEEAVLAFTAHRADLVVTDCHLAPGMSGLDLVAALRERDAGVPVVLVSSDWRVEQDALAAGASCFVLKGGALESLVDALTSVLYEPSRRR